MRTDPGERQRVRLVPLGPFPYVKCWHCGKQVGGGGAAPGAARYLYRGEQPTTVIVETWYECPCGAYQNVRHVNRIFVGDEYERPDA